MFHDMRGDMNMFLKQRRQELQYKVLSWILIPLQREGDLDCSGKMAYLSWDLKVLGHILDQLVTGSHLKTPMLMKQKRGTVNSD
jgi:hypothetical protein